MNTLTQQESENRKKYLGEGLSRRTHFTGKILSIVDDLFLYKRYEKDMKDDFTRIRKVLLNKLTFLTAEEWNLLNREFKIINDNYSNEETTLFDDSFVRSYEGYALLEEICLLLEKYQFNNFKIASYFREGLKLEPDRNNILGLLLLSIINGRI